MLETGDNVYWTIDKKIMKNPGNRQRVHPVEVRDGQVFVKILTEENTGIFIG
jgi:hypothetical protein